MSQFLSVNYSLGKKFYVENVVISKLVKSSVKSLNFITKDIGIDIIKGQIFISLVIAIKNSLRFIDVFLPLTKKINEDIENLVEFKPTNIKIRIEDK